MEWKSSYPQVYIIPYTNSIQNYYSHGYNIRIYSSYVQLYQGNSRQLGAQASFNFRSMKKAQLDVMIDKDKKTVVIFINGKKIKEWKNVNYVPTGNNLVLYGGSYTTSFNNLRISKWDGKVPDTIENKVAKEDLIKFKNGDKMSGKVISIKDNIVKLKTSFAEMPVPVKNITQMTFSADNLARARRNKDDIKAYFVGGSHVTFSLKSISDGKILGNSENFGTANFNMNAFLGLAFNIYDSEQNLTGFESFIYSD